MSLAFRGKKSGLLIAMLLVATGVSFINLTPAHAANARWLNRAVIAYEDDYFIDADPYDKNYKYIAQKKGDSGNCNADEITFFSRGADFEEFYYDPAANNAAGNGELTTYARQGGTGPNADVCAPRLAVPFLTVDNIDNRRITFIRSGDGKTISHILNGAIFSRNGTFSFEGHPVYLSNDTDICKDFIIDTTNDPENDDWFGGGQTAGSGMLFTAKDNDNSLGRTSESMGLILGGTAGVTCKIDDPSVEGLNSRYAITIAEFESELSAAGWGLEGGNGADYILQTLGTSSDDSYIIFIGTTANNTIPGAPVGTTPGAGVGPTGSSPVEVCEDENSGLGYFLCPMVNGFDSFMRTIYENVITPFLTVPPLTTIDGLQLAWQNLRDIANILFILVFFIIIFSQATSIGISNYGIKTLLPKLVIIAILTNISFYICVFLVDAMNIIGAGISSLILVPLQSFPAQPGVNFTGGITGFIQNIAGVTLLSVIITSAGGLLAAAVAFMVPIALLTLSTVLILVLRIVLIVAFVVFSPIIFMGFILPGTSRTSSRLFTGFIGLLAMGPIIMAMVALSGFVIYIINLVLAP